MTPERERLYRAGVVPVLTIGSVAEAVPLAKALVNGGLDVVEITLRTPCAAEAISEIVKADLGCYVGVGTVLTSADVTLAESTGADFIVTPATPPSLVKPLSEFEGLVIPGVSTPGEALTLNDAGFDLLKFFPAEAAGGAAMLKSLSAPLPGLSFMPTGGIKTANLKSYLSLPNVIAAGGSWISSTDQQAKGDWAAIEATAKSTHQLVSELRGH
ncbi:MAG: keto-deoxy-phosphogluconate aldolase [Ponticaulis sp.]|nr:keto-deoxy-phosphogluconate aldolase [Ponticaulis sp.]